MKKVLFFVPEFPRLTETFIEREASKLVERDNLDIQIISFQKATGRLSENLEDKVAYISLSWVSCLMSLKYIFTNFGAVTQSYKWFLQDKTKNLLQRKYLFLKTLGYTYLFEKHSPDHIHAHFLSDPSTMVLAMSKILNVSFSVSAHAKDVFVDGSLIDIKARESKFIAVCNENAWQEVVKQANKSKSSHRVKLMFHGIDPKYIEDTPPKQLDLDAPLIFSVGRLVEKKGLKYLIEASSILKGRGVRHTIKIAGSGPLYDELQELISSLNVNDTVEILNNGEGVANTEVISYLKTALCFTLPNIQTADGDVDGVPTTVIEAAFAKCAIVVTDAGSTTDLIINDETGLLVRQKDAHHLADSLERLIFQEETRTHLAQNAYNKAINMFSLDKNIEELEKLILTS